MQFRRPSGALIASIAIHVVVAVIFVQTILFRHPLLALFGRPAPPPQVEHIGFVTLSHPKSVGAPRAGRSGGDGRSNRPTAPLPPPPISVPTTIPAPVKGPPTASTSPSTGPLIGGGGELRGIQPRYEDPRVWTSPGRVVSPPKTAVQRLDSVIVAGIGAYNDSVAVAQGRRKPGDWTFEKNGQKYGMDSKYIHLGPISLPTAILALLPLNITGNPTTYQRNKTLDARHDEIFAQAQHAINDADFDKAVKSIRERKERERREAEAEKKKEAEQGTSLQP